jgi:hypothetical protein
MSRSKRAPWWTCGYGGTWKRYAKRQANKRVRRLKELWDGMIYKRFYSSWDICDFKILDTQDDSKVRRK